MRDQRKTALSAWIYRPVLALIILTALVGAVVGAWYGVRLYLRFGPVSVCDEVPINPRRDLKSFRISDPRAGEILGSHASLACPEAPRAFFESYTLRILTDKNFMDVLFETRDRDQSWGVVGFGVWDDQLFRPVLGDFAIGEDGHWSKDGSSVHLSTPGPRGRREQSYFRLVDSGPNQGSLEVKIFTKHSELHLFITPLVPGVEWEDVGAERTRPGSWFQYDLMSLMGRVEGDIKLYQDGGEPKSFTIPSAPGGQAFACWEHSWGQSDRTPKGVPTRFYYDWGYWGLPDQRSVIVFLQVDRPKQGIATMVAAGDGGNLPYLFTYHPPVSYARNIYSRLADHEGYLYPQELKVWAFKPGEAGTVNGKGFLRASYGNWQAFDLWARVGGDGQSIIDWTTKPVWSVTDFYKGAQVKEMIPAPAGKLTTSCDDQGCRVEWSLSGPRRKDVEFWVFRLGPGGRLAAARPVAVVEEVLEGASAQTTAGDDGRLSWFDPAGGEGSIYQVVPVYTPPTLFYQRLMAGYERVSAPPESVSGPRETPSGLQGIMGGAGVSDWTPPVDEVPVPGGNRKLRLERDSSGTWELRLFEEEGAAGKYQTLKPRFSKRTQLQSVAAVEMGENLIAAAWSERVPVMDSELYTDWEVFVSVVNLDSGAFYVTPLSMSDRDDCQVSIVDEQGVLRVSWLSCEQGQCREVQQRLKPVTPP